MAFANLFTKLSVIGEAAFPLRNQNENDGKSKGKKRKRESEPSAPYEKKQRHKDHRLDTYKSFEHTDVKAVHSNWQNSGSECASIGRATGNNHQSKGNHTDMFREGQNYTAGNKWNVNRQLHERAKTTKTQRNLHCVKDKRKNTNEYGHHQRRETFRSHGKVWKHGAEDVKRKQVMTQEFKEQNALLADGRLICRHHLRGMCIKGDDCQLEHIQGYNDLIKQVCKFYIQGFCIRGERCPYMHKSFPCKFFHRKGKCSQSDCCRFSHEPLNEVTKRLLDELLKRETDAFASKAELLEKAAKADESEMTDMNTAPDVPGQPLRPNFYNSEQANAANEALPCQDDEPSDYMEQTCPTQTQTLSPQCGEAVQEAPVCYSVEAVLGRQHFRSFPSFFTTPGQSASFPSSSVDQSEVPYSVSAVLGSSRSAGNSTLGYTPSPPAAQAQRDHVTDVHAGLLSQPCSDPTLVSGDQTTQVGEIPQSPKPQQRASRQVKSGLLYLPFTVAEKPSKHKKVSPRLSDATCSDDSNLPFAQTQGKHLTCAPEHLTQLKPHVSVQTYVTQNSVRSLGSSTRLSHSGKSASHFDKTTAKPDKTSIKSFLGLFAAPLLPAPVPSQPHESYHSADTAHLTDSRQRYSDLQMPQSQTKDDETSHRPSSPELTTSPPNETSLNQCEEPQVELSGTSSSLASCGPATTLTANSVLQTLFLCLSPYKQDGEQQDSLQLGVPSESEKNQSSTECVFVKSQPKNPRTKKLKTPSCSLASLKPQPFLQSPQMSSKATGSSTLCSPAPFKPLVRSSVTTNSPAVQRHTESKLKRDTEDRMCMDRNQVVTPLKDLFKTLDLTIL